jgi:carboxyl-terminal processing protease
MGRFLPKVIAVTAFLAGIGVGMVWNSGSYAQKNTREPYAKLDTFAEVLHVVERYYVDDVNREAMIDGAIEGMIRALDPHSHFLTAADRKAFEQRTGGQFVGIGVEIGIRNDELRILTAFHGGPAQKAGLRSGDTILAIDGKDVSQMSLDTLFHTLRGEPNSAVQLTVRHANTMGMKSYTVYRNLVQLDVTHSLLMDNDIGYVALSTFGEGAAKKVQAEIDKIASYTSNGLQGLVLDLRGNPGGFLNEGVALANLFVKSGDIVTTRGRNEVLMRSYSASRSGYEYDMPLAVLIDEASASASEIVAGALQDHKRAVIVGVTSFGKASIQNMYKLHDGSSLKLTIGRYYTPSGKCIQAQGIVPDIVVEKQHDMGENSPIVREKDLEHALKAHPDKPHAAPSAPPENPAASNNLAAPPAQATTKENAESTPHTEQNSTPEQSTLQNSDSQDTQSATQQHQLYEDLQLNAAVEYLLKHPERE